MQYATDASENTTPHLLIVDDDLDLCEVLTRYLEAEDFRVSSAHTGSEGSKAGIEGSYELIVLDVMLPDKKGFDVLREIRQRARTPVLMLTAKGEEFDRVLGLELDLAGRIVTKAGEPLNLTSAEFDLLHMFFEAPGQVLTRDKLVERVLGRKFSPFDRSIDFHVTNLRRKLGAQQNGTERIRSVRGTGYLYAWPNES